MTDRLLVLVRHGQSDWNLKNLFTGWRDVDLTEKGVAEAREAGRKLKAQGINFDAAFTSALIRAQRTLDLMLDRDGPEQNPGVQGSGAQRARLRRSVGAQQGRGAQEMGRGAGAYLAPLLRRGAARRRKPARYGSARAALLPRRDFAARAARRACAGVGARQFAARVGDGARKARQRKHPQARDRHRRADHLPARRRFDR